MISEIFFISLFMKRVGSYGGVLYCRIFVCPFIKDISLMNEMTTNCGTRRETNFGALIEWNYKIGRIAQRAHMPR